MLSDISLSRWLIFFVQHQKKIARESLEIAFGKEKSPEEIDSIARQCFRNFGLGMIEMVYFMSHPKQVLQRVSCEGLEHLDQALKKGNGVVVVTAHFGNFPLMMLFMAAQGYPVHSIIRPARDEKMNAFLHRKRDELGVKTVYAMPRKTCVTQSINALRQNEILFVPMDQNFGSGKGVFVDFFGQKAATATGPVIFSLRTQAPVIPMFILRQEGNRHKIIIEKPISIKKGADEDATVKENIAKITQLIEQYIRRYPHEWGWMHRRWKSKPRQAPGA
jgi:KDO2-lipid IV(A) lauroyltransferase